MTETAPALPPVPVPPARLFDWRRALASPSGPAPTTRLVLLTLSLRMDRQGGSCFPSTATLAAETGLSERAVVTHLRLAAEAGWILVEVAGAGGKGWKRHGYQAAMPAAVAAEALNVVQHEEAEGTERRSARTAEGTERRSEGTEPHDVKALNVVQSNSSGNTPQEGEGARAHVREAQTYPRPTLDEVLARAAMVGIPEADARAFFLHYEAADWQTSSQHPQPVRKWEPKLVLWHQRESKYATAGRAGGAPIPAAPMRSLADEL